MSLALHIIDTIALLAIAWALFGIRAATAAIHSDLQEDSDDEGGD